MKISTRPSGPTVFLPPGHLLRLGPVGVILLATGLRLYRLTFHPLWWDEGLSVFFAKFDFWSMVRAVGPSADVNPPLYRLLLGGWLRLVGWSPFAVRFFSVLAGILLVALVYRVARQLGYTRGMALGAMLLCATSPVLVYYAQEAKGYTLIAAAGTASVILWSQIQRGALPRGHLWVAWGLMVLLAIGSHYMAIFLIATENLWTLALMWQARCRPWRHWLRHWSWQLSTQAVIAVGMLFFVIPTFNGTAKVVEGYVVGGQRIWETLFQQHLVEFALGPQAAGLWATLAGGGLWALAGLGCLADKADKSHRDWLATWLGVPWLGGLAFHLYRDFFSSRFLLYSVPAFLVLAAQGLAWVIRLKFTRSIAWGIGLGSAIWLTLNGLTLFNLYTLPRSPDEDYRPLIAQVRVLARPDDAVLTAYTWQDGFFASYAPDTPLTFYRLTYATPEEAEALLSGVFQIRQRVWVVNYQAEVHDLSNAFNQWLARHAALAYEAQYGDTQLALFVFDSHSAFPWAGQAIFENGLQVSYHSLTSTVHPGDTVNVSLLWQTEQSLTENYKIFVHLRLQPDQPPIAQSDHEPAYGLAPTSTWLPGQSVLDRHAMMVPLNTPPGRYFIYAGVYALVDNTRLNLVSPNGCDTVDSVCLGGLDITENIEP